MPMPPEEEPGYADDIVEIRSYEAPLPVKRTFAPWHLPRKQFVRDHQWKVQLNSMLADVPTEDGTLKYLGLPGADLLDLRHFHSEVCLPRNIGLRFLGFNSAAQPLNSGQTEFNVSLDEVLRLPGIDQRSMVLGDSFERVGNDNSLAWKKARDLGPFDVINLDLCDGFASGAPSSLSDTHYDAVNKLMSLQARRKGPWLLLLTTRVGAGHVHADVLQRLVRTYAANLTQCPAFLAASRNLLAVDDQATLETVKGTANGLISIFLCGLCKWLIRIGLQHQPPTTAEVKSVIGYRVVQGSEHIDLVSLAVRFSPTFRPIDDPLGLAQQPVVAPDECTPSERALRRVVDRRDADHILHENPGLKEQLVNATATLLEQARYDCTAYRAWVEAG
jgi:hypothetical protein